MLRHLLLAVLYAALGVAVTGVVVYIVALENQPDLRLWHLAKLDEEFNASKSGTITDLRAYLELEDRLIGQVHEEVYSRIGPDDRRLLNRFHSGSLSDPERIEPNWNRTFELPVDSPRAGILLVHGMSDSPYSCRALGTALQSEGVYVLALRLPGHGTAPSGLVSVTWQDFAAAFRVGARHVRQRIGDDAPLFLGGYSTGGALAVEYALAVLEGEDLPRPEGLLLFSPAIGVTPVAALAVWQARLGTWLGLEKLAWVSIQPEFDPYKYNSFAVNAGDQVYRLTRELEARLARLEREKRLGRLPRVLAFLSAVDFTIPPKTLLDRLFRRLEPAGHEVVLFDINRHAEVKPLFGSDPKELTEQLLDDAQLPFAVTLVTNASPSTDRVRLLHKPASGGSIIEEPLDLSWPITVHSLSHVAIPFPPDDPLYGEGQTGSGLHLGRVELRGERGLLLVPMDQLNRLRYNPFYSYVRTRVLEFLDLPAE